MAIDFLEHCDVIEECYEFLLGYAAQGLPTDEGSSAGREVRTRLQQAHDAMISLPESCRRTIADRQLEPSAKYEAFTSVLERDARDASVAVELVLAQPSIGSQLIDNLNASGHLRTLLTDLFLFGEIVRTRTKFPVAVEEE
jgi:hypothetical protein